MHNRLQFLGVRTEYNGIIFRSKLEASWARFFDFIDASWEYAPKSFILDHQQQYKPDFKLIDGYVEIKTSWKHVDLDKLLSFVKLGHNLYLCVGKPQKQDIFLWSVLDIDGGYDMLSILKRRLEVEPIYYRENALKLNPVMRVAF